ncbi:unnamed protein product [Withania somnifera]
MVLSRKLIVLLFVSISLLLVPANAIRGFLKDSRFTKIDGYLTYVESPEYCNICDPNLVHVAMTLDSQYFRGSIAAVHSVLKHTCKNIYFHLVASKTSDFQELTQMLKSIFPSFKFQDHRSTRERVVYLDSDVILVDDIQKLWSISLTGSRIIGAPEYCHADFRKYFTDKFWSDPKLSKVFQGRRPCYFNTGVMVMDLGKWRKGDYTVKTEKWMEIQKEKRIYELGSLPPFMLVFGGDIQGIDHRWNQHGLGSVSLLHWSGKGKPWVRLDQGRPCPVDLLWEPYDLYRLSPNDSLDQQEQ